MNNMIGTLNSLRFKLSEPLLLQLKRLKYGQEYENKNQQPLISICTPTYNRAQLLMERAVPSVLNQTYKNFEFIIIGDHCTDDTEKLISKINDPRIRFYNIPKRGYRYPPTAENHWLAGPVVANNQALKMVCGKWIARIDDDDIWTPDHLESLLNFAQNNQYEFVSAQYIEERHGQKKIVDGVYADGSYFDPKMDDLKANGPKIGGVQTWLYRSYLKSFKYNINCWRKKWNRVNDIDLELRMYKAGVKMGFLEKVIGYIIPRPGEDTVGIEAYKSTEQDKLEHFEFKD